MMKPPSDMAQNWVLMAWKRRSRRAEMLKGIPLEKRLDLAGNILASGLVRGADNGRCYQMYEVVRRTWI